LWLPSSLLQFIDFVEERNEEIETRSTQEPNVDAFERCRDEENLGKASNVAEITRLEAFSDHKTGLRRLLVHFGRSHELISGGAEILDLKMNHHKQRKAALVGEFSGTVEPI